MWPQSVARALDCALAEQPYPLVFVTLSGAHLYGFPSPDSDYDLRGVHVLPAREVLGLEEGVDTVESHRATEGLDLDLVTHDAGKFLRLLLKKNGYVLEQLLSPLVLRTSPEHEELRALVPSCLTRYHAFHYLGFAKTEWELWRKEVPPRVKPLLYVYRVLLTGIHLMRTGAVEANLPRLNDEFRLPFIPDLIGRKLAGAEASSLTDADIAFHEREYQRLRAELEAAHGSTSLPERATAKPALSDLLVRLRLRPVDCAPVPSEPAATAPQTRGETA